MGDYAFAYPVTLTNKAWQKKKGVIAKMAVGKTDVGANLTALEAEFNKSQFGKVTAFAGLDPLDFANHRKALNSDLEKEGAELVHKAKAAGVVALAAFGEMKVSKTVPKSVAQYVKTIVDDLDQFEKDVAAYPARVFAEMLKDFKPVMLAASSARNLHDTATKAQGKWDMLMADIKKVEANPTVENFKAVFAGDNPVRLMTTMCKMWDQLVIRDMPTLARTIYPGKAMTDYFKLPCLADVANQTNSTASKAIEQHIASSGQEESRAVTNYMLHLSQSALKVHEMVKFCEQADKIVQAV